MIKNISKLWIEGTLSNQQRSFTRTCIKLNGEKLGAFFLKSLTKQGCLLSLLLLNVVLESIDKNHTKKKYQMYIDWNTRKKTICSWHDVYNILKNWPKSPWN